MAYLAWAIIVVSTWACATFLVVQGHPWFAVLFLLLGVSVSVKDSNKHGGDDEDE